MQTAPAAAAVVIPLRGAKAAYAELTASRCVELKADRCAELKAESLKLKA